MRFAIVVLALSFSGIAACGRAGDSAEVAAAMVAPAPADTACTVPPAPPPPAAAPVLPPVSTGDTQQTVDASELNALRAQVTSQQNRIEQLQVQLQQAQEHIAVLQSEVSQ